MTSETSVLTDFSELNSDTLSAGAVWQPWTCFHSLWHLQRWYLLWKTNTWNRQKSLTSVFPCLVVLEVPNDVSADLLHCLSLLPSRKTSCWKYSRHRETDQKGNQILSPEISCSSGWVCCYCKWFEIYTGQECKQPLLAISNDCYQFYYSQAGRENAVKNTNISNMDCSDNAYYCLRVLLLSIFANSWQQLLVNNIILVSVRAEGSPGCKRRFGTQLHHRLLWLCYFLVLCCSSFLVNIG